MNIPGQDYISLRGEQFGKPVSGSLPTIVRAFKSAVTKRINEIRQTPGIKLWQRNYWERIIRNKNELFRIQNISETILPDGNPIAYTGMVCRAPNNRT